MDGPWATEGGRTGGKGRLCEVEGEGANGTCGLWVVGEQAVEQAWNRRWNRPGTGGGTGLEQAVEASHSE